MDSKRHVDECLAVFKRSRALHSFQKLLRNPYHGRSLFRIVSHRFFLRHLQVAAPTAWSSPPSSVGAFPSPPPRTSSFPLVPRPRGSWTLLSCAARVRSLVHTSARRRRRCTTRRFRRRFRDGTRNVNHRRGEPSCEFVEKFARLAGKEGGTTRVTWHRYGSGGTGRWPLELGCTARLECCCSWERCAYGRRRSGISTDTAIHEERFYRWPGQKWPWNAWEMWRTGMFVRQGPMCLHPCNTQEDGGMPYLQ